MKEHISATIDHDVLIRARKYARQTRRPMSNVIEFALERVLEQENNGATIVTSKGQYAGAFDRKDCYGER